MADKGLTKEYFENHLDRSLKELRSGMTKELKDYTDKSVKELKKHGDQGFALFKEYIDLKFDDLNGRTARGFTDIGERLNVKEEIEKLKRDNHIIKQALHL